MHRGIDDPEHFLAPSKWSDMPSPFHMEGIGQAIALILKAVRSQQRIAVFGDYDCDGVLATAILQATLRKLGIQPAVYLPNRDEGYGFTNEAVHRFSRSGIDLVITIDNGINSVGPVQLARRLAMDVVVVDHHHIETRADAAAVWSDKYCAAALGVMLCWALLESVHLPQDEVTIFLNSLSRLAAIASIADCVPLLGETRTLTKIGLSELGRTPHAGLRKLLLMAGTKLPQPPTSEQIAFRVAPRINAAGRVADPGEVLRMLDATSPYSQVERAIVLDELNRERRKLEKEALEELYSTVGDKVPAGLVIYGAEWPKGIAGILASRVRERYGVPAFVLVHDSRTGMAVGSGRSVEGINLIDALRACQSVLHRFGGHSQAAGVTLAVENIPAFREQFEAFIHEHPTPPPDMFKADADLNLAEANRSFYGQLSLFEPFGVGNPTPVFRVKDAVVRAATPGFVIVRQFNREIKARSAASVAGCGTALVALSGTTATLVALAENP
jgi:single-stranded-DNA-specific exonuclease